MLSGGPERLLELLDVGLEAFALCEIDRSCALDCAPAESILVHFVLDGQGVVSCEHGRYLLRPGRVILIPPNLAKRIEGPAPILSVVDAEQGCPLAPGMVKFRAAASGVPGLVLGCGSITIGLGGTPGLLDHLDRPLVEECQDGPLPMLFAGMAAELRRPGAGTKAMVEALMKQILVVVLRSHLMRRAGDSPLHLMLRNPQLGRAVAAIVTRPEEPHSIDSLAALAGMSRSTFNRQFAASYGCAPMEFVQTVRLRAAARMLAGSRLPVKAVAAAVGYASRSHFSRAFTAEYGMDPSSFRDSGDPEAVEAGAAADAPAGDPETEVDAAAADMRSRMRNTLARARSVARRTGLSAPSVAQYSEDLDSRLAAMARAESTAAAPVGVARLVADALHGRAHEAVGTDMELGASASEAVTLALHELALNSRRHGAIARGEAPRISWQQDDRSGRPWLRLRWEEPGAALEQPRRAGFGTELITRRIAYELGGTGEMEFGRRGFAASIDLPLAPEAAAPAQSRPAAAVGLAG